MNAKQRKLKKLAIILLAVIAIVAILAGMLLPATVMPQPPRHQPKPQ